MAWVVDTCILLDIALPDPKWVSPSAALLAAHQTDGLVICPVTFIELTPHFAGKLDQVEAFLGAIGIDYGSAWLATDTHNAARAWASYVDVRHRDRLLKRPIADIQIGAFALRHHGLLTRNASDFTPWFEGLKVVTTTS